MKDRAEISDLLTNRAAEVAHYLFPNGKHEGREWVVGSVHGEAGHSLKVCIEGGKQGMWCDFADGDKKGDLVSLWHEIRQGQFGETMQEIRGWLGLEIINYARPGSEKKYRSPKPQKGTKKVGKGGDTKVFLYLKNDRKLTAETLADFNIGETDQIVTKLGKTWKNDWIMFPFTNAGKFIGIKYQSIHLNEDGKKVVIPEYDCKPNLFGWRTIKSTDTSICITEGEIDAMSIYQYGHAALSVPFGGGNKDKQQWVEHEIDNLEQFETIYICMDNDKEGEAATTELIERLGRHRCKVVTLPHKDANECLKKGVSKEEIDICFVKSVSLDPAELKQASSFREQTKERMNPTGGEIPGVESPFQKLKNKLRFRTGELSVWSGINGHGKSLLIGQVMMHLAHNGEKICIASLEMKPKSTLARIAKQLSNERKPTDEKIDQCFDWMRDKFWILNVVGEISVNKLLETFKYAYQKYGITQFVIDSFMRCGVDEDDFNGQKKFMNLLVAFVNQYDVHIHLVAHPRKGLNEEHVVGKMDVKGSGCITDLSWNFFAIWRNKAKEALKRGENFGDHKPKINPLDMPDGLFICDKQREGEWEGKMGLYFDPESERYYDDENYRAPNYLGDAETEQATMVFNNSSEDEDENLDEWN